MLISKQYVSLLGLRCTLGLPFLVHNDIIVDAAAQTVVDKICGLDLLHPTALRLPTRPKRTIKEFYQQLQCDQKLMVAKLKMVCHDHLLHTQSKSKHITHVNPITVVGHQIEILGVQHELQNWGLQ